MSVAGKYDPLRAFLEREMGPEVTFSFGDLEALVGPLPHSARDYRAWWGNERVGSHVQARAWLGAGFKVDSVDLARGLVRFARATGTRANIGASSSATAT